MTPRASMMVVVVSSVSRYADIEANLAHVGELVSRAATQGVRLVCFPELALGGYGLGPELIAVAEELPGPVTEQLVAIAAEHDVCLSVGVPEREGDRFYIAQAVVGPKGYLGKYRKCHPTGGESEAGFSAGTDFPIFDIDGFRLGINICFDGRHQDTIEAMKNAGVDIIHHPHGNSLGLGANAEEWTRGKLAYFAARAIHARAYILISNSAGDMKMPQGTAQFGSGAMVVDPLGQAIARTTQTDRGEKMLLAAVERPLAELIPAWELKRLREDGVTRP